MYSSVPAESGKKRGRINGDNETTPSTTTKTPTVIMAGGGGPATTKNWNYMVSSLNPAPLSAMAVPTTTMATTAIAANNNNNDDDDDDDDNDNTNDTNNIHVASTTTTSNSKPSNTKSKTKSKNNKNSNKSKEDILSSLGLLPNVNKIRVKSCDPTAGLTLGGKPVTEEQLKNLSPMDLEEHVLMRNGQPLEIDELARLLGMEEDFDEEAFALDETSEEDELILGMIENGMLDMFFQSMAE
eukprot:CAMPEP_0116118540 /NCGR_PEP_ID=MMETSP0329-20121206/2158_1 /TAXON_ID=697910 /ORGANISM="Pseudo-nitzschia arenysensis, Strain B593" /LENGTH=240 /DNA_ID=CAMNT_0003612173 /DNA_START=67 /DNA_END=789 /DNA_ORIENTATION=+